MTAGYYPLLPTREDWLVRRVIALERQVLELQAARITRGTVDGGDFAYTDTDTAWTDSRSTRTGGWDLWYDAQGRPRKGFGTLSPISAQPDPDQAYLDGAWQEQGGGLLLFRDGDLGWTYPNDFPHVSSAVTWNWTTSASFTALYRARVDHCHHEVVVVHGYAQVDTAGTVGDLRLRDEETGQATGVVTIASTSQTCFRFTWLHPAGSSAFDPRGRSHRLTCALEARRTQGTGQVQVYEPRQWEMTSLFLEPDAATGGLPTLC